MMQKIAHLFSPKRLIALILILLLVCAGIFFWKQHEEAAPDNQFDRIAATLSGPWNAKLQMQYGDFSALCDFNQQYIGECEFRFLSPVSLEGFALKISDGKINLAYKDMSCAMPADRLFSSSGAGKFLEAVSALTERKDLEISPEEESGNFTVSIPDETSEEFLSISFDKNGVPLSVDFPKEAFSVTISDFVSSTADNTSEEEKASEGKETADSKEKSTEEKAEEKTEPTK